MKRLSFCALILALFVAPAFAEKNVQSMNFPSPVKVGATQLPAGDYKISWTGTGDAVQVTLEQKNAKNPATATVPAKMVDGKHAHNGFVISRKDGADAIDALQFNKFDLVFAGAPAQGQ